MKFNVLYVDPPWQYRNDGKRGKLKGAVSKQYNSLSIDDLKKLEVCKIVEKDCILFLWVTNPFIKEGLELVESWGFEYKTMITWIKRSYGLGYYFRSKTEHILLGIKGSIKAFRSNRPNIIQITTPYKYKHSEKPEEFRDIIDEISNNSLENPKKLEMFARKDNSSFIDCKKDWTFIGNEIDGLDIREAIDILNAKNEVLMELI